MIALITGKLGGGKTLYAVGVIYRHLVKGGIVATNVELVRDELEKLARRRDRVELQLDSQLVPLDLKEDESWHLRIPWGDIECGVPVLVVLDEVHLWFNSRDWAATQAKHRLMLSFLSQSRKAGVEIRFICQSASNLDKQFRLQCEVEIFTRHVRDIQIPLMGAMPWNCHLIVHRDNAAEGPGVKPLKRELVRPDRALFPCYRSYSMLDAQMLELQADRPRVQPLKLRRVRWDPRPALRVVLGLAAAVGTLKALGKI